jgi:multiple sugar transport system substrate-binding protein
MVNAKKRIAVSVLLASTLVGSMAACSQTAGQRDSDGSNLTLWTHNGGNEAELTAVKQVVEDFNSSQSDVTVTVEAFPQASYNDSVVAAASSGKLACIIDVDGPNAPNWAWANYITPLDIEEEVKDFLPTVVGRWDDKIYSIGHYDVALALYAKKSVLEENGIRIATFEQPWTREEFDDALAKLKDAGDWDYPLDIVTGDVGEWYPYAYSPMLQSFGGDLINRSDFQSAEGAINSPQAVEWATWLRSLVENGYTAAKSGTDAAIDFQNGKSAILYSGSWAADQSKDVLGDDLVIMPAVDFGNGPKIGGGSWQWAISENCANKEGALEYLKFSLQDKYVASISKATGTIPATDAAAAELPDFAPGGKNEIFRQFAADYAVLRPETPAYPYIASKFTVATQDILNGADAQATLDSLAKDIDQNISSTGGYPNT